MPIVSSSQTTRCWNYWSKGNLTYDVKFPLTKQYTGYRSVGGSRPYPADPFWSGTSLACYTKNFADSVITSYSGGTEYHRTLCEHYSGVLFPGIPDLSKMPTTIPSDLLTQALNKCRSEVKREATNLAQMLGEYRQAADLFSSAFRKMYFITKAIVHRDPRILMYDYYKRSGRLRDKFGPRSAKDLSALHLEFIYGVKPLMSDVHQIMVDLRTRFEEKPVEFEVTKVSIERLANSFAKASVVHPGVSIVGSWQGIRRCRVQARIRLKNDILLNSIGAYGFTNPAALMYELTPFSFVLDWWLNVGEVLGSLDSLLYVDQTKSGYIANYLRYYACAASAGTGTYSQVNRDVWRDATATFNPVAQLQYKSSASAIHIANGTALAVQLFGSFHR